jgi:hypothetical protein
MDGELGFLRRNAVDGPGRSRLGIFACRSCRRLVASRTKGKGQWRNPIRGCLDLWRASTQFCRELNQENKGQGALRESRENESDVDATGKELHSCREDLSLTLVSN